MQLTCTLLRGIDLASELASKHGCCCALRCACNGCRAEIEECEDQDSSRMQAKLDFVPISQLSAFVGRKVRLSPSTKIVLWALGKACRTGCVNPTAETFHICDGPGRSRAGLVSHCDLQMHPSLIFVFKHRAGCTSGCNLPRVISIHLLHLPRTTHTHTHMVSYIQSFNS